MSRTIANLALGLVDVATATQSDKRRAMTLARVVEKLESRSDFVVPTRRGPLRFLTMRGPHVSGAAHEFETSEPEMLVWLDTIGPDETLWDVGAAIGVYSMYAALGGVQVMAFEPKATSLGLLVEHLALNGLGAKVTPLCLAFTDVTGILRLRLATLSPASGGNNVESALDDPAAVSAAAFEQAICAYAIDDFRAAFGLAAPDHLKIDVDGVEGLILRGAKKTLPLIKSVMVEVEGDNARDAATRIDEPLLAAGFIEDMAVRDAGSRRNRLYRRAP